MRALALLLGLSSNLYPAVAPGFAVISKQAVAARDANRVADAIDLFTQAVHLNAEWGEGWYSLGSLLYDKDRFAEAAAALQRFNGIDGKSGPGWVLLGLCEYEIRRYDDALLHLQRGLSIGVGDARQMSEVGQLRTVQLLTRSGQYEAALAGIVSAPSETEDDPSLIVAAGLAALRKPLLASELAPAEQELVITAGKPVFHTERRRADAAAPEFQELVSKFPREQYVHYLNGSFLLTRDPDAGIAELKRELELFADSVPAMLQLAYEYLKRGDADAALPFARTAVAYDPDSFKTHNALGRALVELGQIEKGVEALETSAKLAPSSPQAHIALASAYAKAGRKEDAERERAAFQKLRQQN